MASVDQLLAAYTHEMLLGAIFGAALWIQFVYRQDHERHDAYTTVIALSAITIGGFSTLYVMPYLLDSGGMRLVGRAGNVVSYALIAGGVLMTADAVRDQFGSRNQTG